MRHTADQVLGLAPDRLAVYSFARVPWIKPQQRKFKDEQIPVGAEKRALYEAIRAAAARHRLRRARHGSLRAAATTALARAAAAGTMHRNFQGYTERRTTVLLGLGVSAISETPGRATTRTRRSSRSTSGASQRDEIPTLRGHLLSDDDRRRREQDPVR